MWDTVVVSYFKIRYRFFKWRYHLTFVGKVLLALGMAGVTGLAAKIKIPLFWTPVPITAQTFAVLLSGVLLGRWWGGISQLLYVMIGAVGVPWFAAGGGYKILFGPTGGYIFGFILASLFLGYFTDKYIRSRGFLSMLGLMLFANFVLIHVPGLLQLGAWFYLVKRTSINFYRLLLMGTLPFIPGDITKIIITAIAAKAITPKQAYNGEVDG